MSKAVSLAGYPKSWTVPFPRAAAGMTLSSSALNALLGSLSPSMPLSSKYRSPVAGWKSKPAGFRSPFAIRVSLDATTLVPRSVGVRRLIDSPSRVPVAPAIWVLPSVTVRVVLAKTVARKAVGLRPVPVRQRLHRGSVWERGGSPGTGTRPAGCRRGVGAIDPAVEGVSGRCPCGTAAEGTRKSGSENPEGFSQFSDGL